MAILHPPYLSLTAHSLPWVDPLEVFPAYAEDVCAFLYSATPFNKGKQVSYLAYDKENVVTNLEDLESALSPHSALFDNSWYGYLGYEVKDQLENFTTVKPAYVSAPNVWFARFNTILVFEHHNQTLTCWSKSEPPGELKSRQKAVHSMALPETIRSNMSREEYLNRVSWLIKEIHKGTLYQANLTRKFYGKFAQKPDYATLFVQLCLTNPTNYSAFLNTGEICVLSSSPERFITGNAQGYINARPIKGTAPRNADQLQDKANLNSMKSSAKEQAENLMIVDLMRNDLARGCIAGSIKVDSLFDVDSYTHVHHLSSSISGQRRADISRLELVKACFPPGSMTGAPKIKAMELCQQLEQQQRGIYSGALGYFAGDGAFDLSVVIRTLLIKDKSYEFQVGGAIVADSDPLQEWEETLAKAQGICHILGIENNIIRNI